MTTMIHITYTHPWDVRDLGSAIPPVTSLTEALRIAEHLFTLGVTHVKITQDRL